MQQLAGRLTGSSGGQLAKRGWGGILGPAPYPSTVCLPSSGSGFEWEDDFPLMAVKASVMPSLTSAAPEPALPGLPPTLVPAQKQVLPIQFSRFTVSPAPVSRFSITHVTDSDTGSVGGKGHSGSRRRGPH